MEFESTSDIDRDLSFGSDDGVIEDLYSDEEGEDVNILTTDDVEKYMQETIEFVTSVVQIRTSIARVLLNHVQWNTEFLLERLFEDDQERIFKEAKIANPFHSTTPMVRTKQISEQENCAICCIPFHISQMIGLECDHRFCSVCWESYLHNQIVDVGNADKITCPNYECPVLVDETICSTILKNSQAQEIYRLLIRKSFVECNPLMAWCPNPECTNAVKVEFVETQSVTCACKATFCFTCKADWHGPMKCELIKQWKTKCRDDPKTNSWLLTNTKDCPKCKTAIEKNGGCNHMTCANKTCRHNFCWICRFPWQSHRSCNVFEEIKSETSESPEHSVIKRYLFYYERYMTHQQSLAVESKLFATVSDKTMQLDPSGVTYAIKDILLKAVDGLSRCRRTLMYTYVFAYYLQKTNQTEIFEANQTDLQRATEDLSECLEHCMGNEDLSEKKLEILNLLNYCEGRRVVLENHVGEGYKDNSWNFNHEA